ncbi:MAG TPA: TIGR02594 family protein [Pyrinomonadaceae bacterium]|nr:TIGR02594 family protein [Pyrinomonadaceae bacterium]
MSQFRVIASSLNVRDAANRDTSTIVGKLPKGTVVEPTDLSLSEDWFFIDMTVDGKNVKGWIFKDYCVPVDVEPAHTETPPWLTTAEGEMGIKEAPGTADNPRIIEYAATTSLGAKDDAVAWCSAFVNWCMKQNDMPRTKSAAARSWLSWGTPLSEPRKGCVVVLKRGSNPAQGHVGFYVGDGAGSIRVLGGNQSDQVKVSVFPNTMLLGYRWPS